MQLTLLKSKLDRATMPGTGVDQQDSLTTSAAGAEFVWQVRRGCIPASNVADRMRRETSADRRPAGRSNSTASTPGWACFRGLQKWQPDWPTLAGSLHILS